MENFTAAAVKPQQPFWGLWNISFGYLGIQIAFGLQNANISRIFQSLGSSIDNLAFLWMAGPVTGLIVQPLIGHYSDKTWGRYGRRRPYFMAGAVLAMLALFLMPHASTLLVAALLLWLLDASLNVSMEPFRAFVGDMVPQPQRASGFAFQTWFIGLGAVIGSLAPYVLTKLGVPNTAAGGIPPSVRYAFYIGAVAIVGAVLYTVLKVREYPPEQMAAFARDDTDTPPQENPRKIPMRGIVWLIAGLAVAWLVAGFALDKQLYVLGGALAVFGLLQLINQFAPGEGALGSILSDMAQMPDTMKRLAVVQFFTWLGLFIMWIYTTPVVTQYIYHSTDTASKAYNDGGDWVGILFAIYNAVAAVAAFALPHMTARIGNARTHLICLAIGALSYAAIFFIRDAGVLILPFIGLGVMWASILTMPYVILTDALPPSKLGIYIGVFNFFIVLPQLAVASIMGGIMRSFFPHDPIWTMALAALVMAFAAVAMLRVESRTHQTLVELK